MKSTGYLRFDPRMKGQKVLDPFWLILQCDSELVRYYKHWVFKGYFEKIMMPAWGAHITVIRNEKPAKPELWGKRAGDFFEFEYDPEIRTNGRHYWLKVSSPSLLDFREELGLRRNPPISLHLTIGNADY